MPDGRMLSYPVIVNLYVLEYRRRSCRSGSITLPIELFNFQRVKEALHSRVIVTVPPATHATTQPLLLNQPLVRRCAVLATSIQMDNGALGEAPSEQCHRQCIDHQLLRHALVHRPAHNRARVQIHDHSQIQLAFIGPLIRDVADPLLVRMGRCEVLAN